MSSRSATSSDLDLARTLSRKLAVPGGGTLTRPLPGPGYVHFAPRPTAPPPERPPSEGLAIELRRFESWDGLLAWCLSLTHASTAFVMDPEGFAIAHQGPLSVEEIQGVGSQLMVAMSQADQLEHASAPALSVCVEFEAFWLSGLRLQAEGRGAFTVGFIAAEPVDRDTRDAIRLQATHNLAHL
jgi:hypothetical protein